MGHTIYGNGAIDWNAHVSKLYCVYTHMRTEICTQPLSAKLKVNALGVEFSHVTRANLHT